MKIAVILTLFSSGFEGSDPPVVDCIPLYFDGVVGEWNQTFDTWPDFNGKKRLFVPLNGYLSYRFTSTNSPNQFGSFITTGFPGDGDGVGIMSISRTPGCFNPAKLPFNCISNPALYASIGWSNGGSQYSCVLNVGQTYYLNYTYGGIINAGGPYCPGNLSGCGADVGNIQQ